MQCNGILMLCYAMLCYTMIWYDVLPYELACSSYRLLYYNMIWDVLGCSVMLDSAMACYTVIWAGVLYCAMLYEASAVLGDVLLCYVVQCYTTLCYDMPCWLEKGPEGSNKFGEQTPPFFESPIDSPLRWSLVRWKEFARFVFVTFDLASEHVKHLRNPLSNNARRGVWFKSQINCWLTPGAWLSVTFGPKHSLGKIQWHISILNSALAIPCMAFHPFTLSSSASAFKFHARSNSHTPV